MHYIAILYILPLVAVLIHIIYTWFSDIIIFTGIVIFLSIMSNYFTSPISAPSPAPVPAPVPSPAPDPSPAPVPEQPPSVIYAEPVDVRENREITELKRENESLKKQIEILKKKNIDLKSQNVSLQNQLTMEETIKQYYYNAKSIYDTHISNTYPMNMNQNN